MYVVDLYVKDGHAYSRLKAEVKENYPKAKINKTSTVLLEDQPILVMFFEPGPTIGPRQTNEIIKEVIDQ